MHFATTLAMFLGEKSVRILNLTTPTYIDRPPHCPRSDVPKPSKLTPTGVFRVPHSHQAKPGTMIYVAKDRQCSYESNTS
jgi:hypothetical protein